jgi:pimeloyl-ACP methyl ester carboxylesterase
MPRRFEAGTRPQGGPAAKRVLTHRSKYAELRIVAGSGHRMHQEKPEAIAQAIHDVLEEVKQQRQ